MRFIYFFIRDMFSGRDAHGERCEILEHGWMDGCIILQMLRVVSIGMQQPPPPLSSPLTALTRMSLPKA